MEDTIITWNFENWFTVLFMAFVGFMVLGLVAQMARKAWPSVANATSTVVNFPTGTPYQNAS